MPRAYQYMLEFKDQATDKMKKVAREMSGLDDHTRKLKEEMRQAGGTSRGMAGAFEFAAGKAKGLVSQMGAFIASARGLATSAALAGILMFGSHLSSAGSTAEQTRVSFETMLGSADKAKAVLADLNQFANVTPFTNDEVVSSGQKLLAFGVQIKDLLPTMRNIGDVAAGLNIPFSELSEIYGKIKVQQTAYSEDLNQLAGRGIPIFTELADVMGVPSTAVKKLASEGKITFTEIEKAFQNLTKEGGKFYNLMAKQSETFGGKVSTLKGKLGLLAQEYGEGLNKKLAPALNKAIELTDLLIDTTKSASQKYADQSMVVKKISSDYQPLIDQYKELSTKATLTKDEETKLKDITQQLGDALPGIVTKWDKFGKAIQLSGDEFSRFSTLQSDYLKELNKDAMISQRSQFKSQLIQAEQLYTQLNYANEQSYSQNVFGLIAQKYDEKFKNKIATENLAKYRSLMGDESGIGAIGTYINEIRSLNGLSPLTAQQIADFNGIKTSVKDFGAGVKKNVADFSSYEQLFTKDFGANNSAETQAEKDKKDKDLKDKINGGVDQITAGGSKSITINMGGVKVADEISIMPSTLSEGLADIETKMQELLIRTLQGGLHTAGS